MTPDQARTLALAEQHLQSNRLKDAEVTLNKVANELRTEPRWWWSRAALARLKGDAAAAEEAFIRTGQLDPRSPVIPNALGELFAEQGRFDEAVAAWTKALELAPDYPPSAGNLAGEHLRNGDAHSALALLDASMSGPRPDPGLLHLRGMVRTALGQPEAAVADFHRLVTETQGDPRAVVALAQALFAMGSFGDGEAQLQRLLAMQPTAAIGWRTLALGLVYQDRLAEAQQALERGLELAGQDPGLHRDLAELIWSRTGDADQALAALEAALAARPADPNLTVVKAKVLEFAGRPEEGRALLSAAAGRADSPNVLLCAASQALTSSDPQTALELARRASARAPNDTFGLAVLAEAELAVGASDRAEEAAARLRRLAPMDQHGVALLATAWRLAGDDRYRSLYDYEALVKSFVIETPQGWADLDSYLAELGWVLKGMHGHSAHPVGQSVRGGTQTTVDLQHSPHPALRAFFDTIDAPIRNYIAGLGEGADPLRSRRGESYRLTGAWSVQLQPQGGSHVDHLHNNGWISSAFYVSVPAALMDESSQGNLRFGKPGTPTSPPLEAEHRVAPKPGMLVLFPSYMWHGVEPFTGDEPRLTIAFDVVPV